MAFVDLVATHAVPPGPRNEHWRVQPEQIANVRAFDGIDHLERVNVRAQTATPVVRLRIEGTRQHHKTIAADKVDQGALSLRKRRKQRLALRPRMDPYGTGLDSQCGWEPAVTFDSKGKRRRCGERRYGFLGAPTVDDVRLRQGMGPRADAVDFRQHSDSSPEDRP